MLLFIIILYNNSFRVLRLFRSFFALTTTIPQNNKNNEMMKVMEMIKNEVMQEV